MSIVCSKCSGSGKYKNYGECNSCKGTGENVVYNNSATITFQGNEYKSGDVFPYINTASKLSEAVIESFSIVKGDIIKGGNYSLKDVWCNMKNVSNRKPIYYPLWKMIGLKKVGETIFSTAVVYNNQM